MTKTFRLALVAAFVALYVALPSAASAHARLLKSNPQAGSSLKSSPQEIQLFLSESVTLEFSSIKVLNRAREEQPTGPVAHVNGDDRTVSAPVTGTLPPGVYTVVWSTLSSVDGHVTTGIFAFRVLGDQNGTPSPDEPITPVDLAGSTPFEGTADTVNPFRWLVRAAMLAAAALLLGGPVFALLVVEPTAAASGEAGAEVRRLSDARLARVGLIAAAGLLLALLLDLILQVASARGTDLFGALAQSDSALLVLTSTRYGLSWALKALAAVALLIIMLAACLREKGRAGLWEFAIAAASLLILAQSIGSHAAAYSAGEGSGGLPLPVISDWLHLVTVGAWAGGLGFMALALFPAFKAAKLAPDERRAFLGQSIPRFSRLAVISVILLAVTGTYNLLIHSSDPGAILGSLYGQVLALKIGLFAALVALGAVNLRRLSPMLVKREPRGGDGAPARLQRNILLEVALASLAVLCAGGLTLLPPPSNAAVGAGPVAVATPATPAATPRPASAASDVAGYSFGITASTSLEGDDLVLNLLRDDPASPPLTDVARVLFRVIPQDIDAGTTQYEAEADGEAGPDRQTWRLRDTIFTLEGSYLLNVVVQRTVADDVRAAFRVDLLPDALQAAAAQVVDIRLDTEPSPPISGTTTLTVTLLDGAREPIEGARLTINPLMPAHAHAQEITEAKPVPSRPGVYTTQIPLDMGGEWLFIFNVEMDGQPPMKGDARLEVIGPTPTPEVVSPP